MALAPSVAGGLAGCRGVELGEELSRPRGGIGIIVEGTQAKIPLRTHHRARQHGMEVGAADQLMGGGVIET
jgi:hypothetical protein